MSSSIDKAELVSKIQKIEGLTNDERSSLIGLLREHKKYGLVWEDKPEDVEEKLRDELPVLSEVKDKAIISDDPDAPNHILIEGDNLEALTALSYTHEGRIDVIYIDPPYNTGNKDFVYNDSFVDSEDSYRHSKWLSFMNKRLKIAKKLLSDKGVIFISIDDNEQAQLKMLCDEILGSQFFVTLLPRLTKKAGKTTSAIAVNHDIVLVYSRRNEFKYLEHNDPAFKHKDEWFKERGCYKLSQTLDYDTLGYVNSLDYPITIDGKTYYAGNVSESEYKQRKQTNPKDGFRWRWSEDLFNFGCKNGFVVVKKSKKGERIYTKTYKNATIGKSNEGYIIEYKERGNIFSSIQLVSNEFSNDIARKELDSIFSTKSFNYPKPTSLPKNLIWLASDNDSTVLDFFAGSGTTLHATMQLNAEDGGHRQCILVTNNENNICEEVTYERNKRVINGYTTPKGVDVAGLKANTLRYYKTDFIPRDRTQKNMRDLVAAATDLLCIKEDLYEEQKTFGRFKLRPQLARYFNDGKKNMLIVYREELIDDIAEEIKTLDFGKSRLKIYVFSPGRYAFTDSFSEVEDKVELVALPAAIYDAYQKVLPKRKEKLFEVEEKENDVIPTDLFAGQEEGGEA